MLNVETMGFKTGVELSKTARAGEEIIADGRLDEHAIELIATMRVWRDVLDEGCGLLDERLSTDDVPAQIEHDLRTPETRAQALVDARRALASSSAFRTMLGNGIALVDTSLPRAIGVIASKNTRLAADAESARAALRAALVRQVELLDDAIDIVLVIEARLDPENDGPSISLADLEAKLRDVTE